GAIVATALCGQGGETDLDKLQGTWMATAMVHNGKAAPKEIVEKVSLTFNGDKVEFDGPMASAKGEKPTKPEFKFKLYSSKKPKSIDMLALAGKFKGQTQLGIYELDGDELKLCLPNQEGKVRPSEFQSLERSDLVVISLKRSKK